MNIKELERHDMIDIEQLYEKMYKIRCFEEHLLKLFSENKLKGTTHTGIGQEADAVAVMNFATENDYIFSNHRCHGQFIAYSDDAKVLYSEIMGKATGMCRGRGGSQHICYKKFRSNGVQGGIVPNATGVALAKKLDNRFEISDDGIAIVFLGDGTLGQGVVYESMNMASLYELPILYIVEDNGYAMTTKTSDGVAGEIIDRANAFGIQSSEIISNNILELIPELGKAFEYVRTTRKPFFQVIHTYRLGPHSKGDDFRDESEKEYWKKQDPLRLIEAQLDKDAIERVQSKINKEIDEAIKFAELQNIDDDIDVYRECWDAEKNSNSFESLLNCDENIRCVTALNDGIKATMAEDDTVFIMGEDIKDPYGGAFKVTKGLSTIYSDRIINTPISEAGFIGLCVGAAMAGYKPIADLMFGDFITLGFDQLLNHATKYGWMYADQVKIPMLLRAPMGGGRGYGATHSQSLEKYLIGMPNLRVLAMSRLLDGSKFIRRILKNIESPTVLIENKKMYGEKLFVYKDSKIEGFRVEESENEYSVYKLSLVDDIADCCVITYGAMTDLAMNVAKKMMIEEEVNVNVIVNTSLSPLEVETIVKYIGNTKNVITLEEGTMRAGWGAEVVAALNELGVKANFSRIAAKDCVIPCGSELEGNMLPSEQQLINTLRRMLNE